MRLSGFNISRLEASPKANISFSIAFVPRPGIKSQREYSSNFPNSPSYYMPDPPELFCHGEFRTRKPMASDRQTGRQAGRERERKKKRQREREREKETERERQTDRQRNRERERERQTDGEKQRETEKQREIDRARAGVLHLNLLIKLVAHAAANRRDSFGSACTVRSFSTLNRNWVLVLPLAIVEASGPGAAQRPSTSSQSSSPARPGAKCNPGLSQ